MTLTAPIEANIPIIAATKTACYHCGETCPDEHIHLDEKKFCCEGCKMVFEILHANDLCGYYQIESNAGISLKGRRKEEYAWLDDPATVARLIDFTDGEKSKTTFYLPQIHCASCLWLLENLYKLSPGILSSKVNFLRKEATLTFSESETSLRKIVELLASIGYAPDLNLGSLDAAKRKPVSRRLLYQLGLAGFAFGNIMLLSFPEYLGLEGTDEFFRNLFGYTNILLATPVLVYSGQDYIKGAWHSLRTRNLGIDVPLALGMIVLYGRSAWEIISGAGAGYMDSLAGLVFFLLIGKWFQQMTYHRISFERDYKSYFPVSATKLLTGGKEENLTIDQLETGDRILLRNGEIIPADGILKRGTATIDYSFVTGESVPVTKQEGEKIFAGGRHSGEAIEILLTKKTSQSYLTKLWDEDAFHDEKLSGPSQLANKISRRFTAIILLISVVTLFWWLPIDPQTAFYSFTAVLIIACPCAAALNIPFTLGNTIRLLAKEGFFLKNTNVVEALHHFSAVVFDKTGTLTHAADSQLEYEGEPLTDEEKAIVATLARQSSHPMSRQLAKALGNASFSFEVTDFQEVTGKGIVGKIVEVRPISSLRATRSYDLKIGSHRFVFSDNNADEATTSDPNFTNQNVLNGNVFIVLDGQIKGSFRLHDRYRGHVWQVLDAFRSRAKIYLLSGDNEAEKAYLSSKFGPENGAGTAAVHFHQSPKDKLDFIKKLQESGEKTIMLGDGLNDAGALRQSDVGIVVAENANNFTPACDAILDARQFAKLPAFIDIAKSGIHVVYAAWVLAGLYNIVGLSYAVQGLLSPVVAAILMPASSLTIVFFGVGMSTLLAKRKLRRFPQN